MSKRSRDLEVLALGVGRTGTDSLRVALEELGFTTCYHGYSCIHDNPSDCILWNKAMDAKFKGQGKPWGREEFDQLLGHCAAVSDLPCVLFYEELLLAYPDAKVLLTKPPAGFQHWYDSCMNTLIRVRNQWRWDFWSLFHSEMRLTRRTFWRAFDYFWTKDFPGNAEDVFERHNQRIKLLAAGRLLEYSVTEGWGPLCHFLERPIPDNDFPTSNSAQNFFQRIFAVAERRKREAILNCTLFAVGGAMSLVIMQNPLRYMYNLFRLERIQ